MVNNQAIAFHRDLYKITTFTGWTISGADFIQSQTMAKKTSCLMVFQIGSMKASMISRKMALLVIKATRALASFSNSYGNDEENFL